MRSMTVDAVSPAKFLSFDIWCERADLGSLVDDAYSDMRLA